MCSVSHVWNLGQPPSGVFQIASDGSVGQFHLLSKRSNKSRFIQTVVETMINNEN